MGVMAVGLFITILLLFHQISSSIQESVQVDPSTSPNDRDEIRDRRTLNSKKDCLDTVLLRSCRRNLNETQQELVEAPGKISGLEREIARERNETKDKDVEMSRLTAKMAQIEANLMGKNAKLEADLVDGRESNRELERKIAETKRKNADLEAQLRTQNTEARDGKVKIGELEGKINALQSKNFDLETQIQFEWENKTAEIVKLQADLNRTMTFLNRDGWAYLAKTASWYKVIAQYITFDEAEAYCASRKGHLVSIHSQEENDLVRKLAKNIDSNSHFWIGLKRNPKKENAFEWTDRSPLQFTNWRVVVSLWGSNDRTDLNTHAILGSHSGKWYSKSPTYQPRFICKRSSQF